MTALKSALVRSCHHQASASFEAQVSRLTASGFPNEFLGAVAERLVAELRGKRTKKTSDQEKKKIAVIPYVHGVSHRLKKVGNRADVRVVFSARTKLNGLCRRVNSDAPRAQPCSKKHDKRYRECDTAVVYDIPLSCGRSYIGQTGRCVNDRLREHANTVKNRTGSNLATHCASCENCWPLLERCDLIKKHKDQITREIVEAFQIAARGDKCVSKPSVTLTAKEMLYLKG